MLSLIKSFIKQRSPKSHYQSLNTIMINSARISQNLHTLQQLQPHHTIIPVVKSNAYGHGIKQICQILMNIKDISLSLIAVDSYPEYQIVADTTDKDILVLGETFAINYNLYNAKRVHLAVGSLDILQALINTGKSWNIHLFLNTGMNREWLQKEDLFQSLKLLQYNPQLHVTGVMSHLANADISDNTFTEVQITLFEQYYQTIIKNWHNPSYIHISNSAGISKIKHPLFTASRTGLALYGYNPLEIDDPCYTAYERLQPALRLQSTVIATQILQPGEGVNYGLQWIADQETTLTTLPLGYNEWLPRLAGQWYEVYHNTTPLPIRGRVCMNLSSCDTTHHHIQRGDSIEVIWRDNNKKNTIWQLSIISQTIPYVILTWLDKSIRRVIV